METIIPKDYLTTVTILEHISDSIFILDDNTHIQYANKAALDMLKTELEQLQNIPISDVLQTEKKYLNQENGSFPDLIEYIDQGIFSEIEMSMINDKTKVPVVVSCGLVKNSKQQIQYIIVSAKDISIKKLLEKEQEQKKELSQSQNHIESMGDLAVSLVHQLTQPLSTIKLQVELTQLKLNESNQSKDNIAENLERISSLLDNMSDSINNVRSFANKVDDHGMKLVDLNESIQQAIDHISYELQEKNIFINIDSEKELPFVSAVPIYIEQTFIMLIKYFKHKFNLQQHNNHEYKVFFNFYTVQNKWIEILISDNQRLVERKIRFRKSRKNIDVKSQSLFELSTIKAVIGSMGGDVKIREIEDNTLFLVRIPASESSEREQLFNLIDLLHKDA